MARRKRSRRLGGDDDFHISRIRREGRNSAMMAQSVTRQADAGNCDDALETLVSAAIARGGESAHTHSLTEDELLRWEGLHKTYQSLARARKAVKKCYLKGRK